MKAFREIWAGSRAGEGAEGRCVLTDLSLPSFQLRHALCGQNPEDILG